MTKQRVINSHKMQQKGKRPHRTRSNWSADVARIDAMHKLGNDIADVKQELPLLRKDIEGMIVRDRLLTAQLAGVCNALADVLGLPADQIDPNRLPEYVKELAARGQAK